MNIHPINFKNFLMVSSTGVVLNKNRSEIPLKS